MGGSTGLSRLPSQRPPRREEGGDKSLMAHLCMCGDRGSQGPPSPTVTPTLPNRLSPLTSTAASRPTLRSRAGHPLPPPPLGWEWGLARVQEAPSATDAPTRDRAFFPLLLSASPASSAAQPAPWGRGRKLVKSRGTGQKRAVGGWGLVLFKMVVYDSYTNLYKDIKALFIKKLSLSHNCVHCVCKNCSV